jgi:hypothetical protein
LTLDLFFILIPSLEKANPIFPVPLYGAGYWYEVLVVIWVRRIKPRRARRPPKARNKRYDLISSLCLEPGK